jgi:preprotein translocase subunit SecE
MSKLLTYFGDSYSELMERVTWPTWDQLTQSTMVVIGASLFVTFLVWIMDLASSGVMSFVYSLFVKK